MAVFPAVPLVSPEEYLNSSYRPDMEYVDGVLVERGMPTIAHSLLQMILIEHFRQYRKELRFKPLPEVRTKIIERARYRIPDVILCPVPLPPGKVITTIPWVVIEILSPDDKLKEQLERFQDYARIGVGLVMLLDPERLVARRFEDGSLIKTHFAELRLPSGSLPFDTEALFRQLVEERSEGL
jgi:Uma2 family endonuclease